MTSLNKYTSYKHPIKASKIVLFIGVPQEKKPEWLWPDHQLKKVMSHFIVILQ